jgi:AcrR family transcriptional regulator
VSKARDRILDIAESLFMRRGYESVKLKDIAEELAIKQPSLYYHFPQGKEELYFSVVERALNRVNIGIKNAIDQADHDIRSQLLAIGEWAIEDMLMSPVVMFRVDFPKLSQDRMAQLSVEAYSAIFIPLKDMLENAEKRNEVANRDPDVVAGLILSSLEGINQGVTWQRMSKYEIWESLVDTLLHGILNSKSEKK